MNPISKFFLYKRHGLVRYLLKDTHSLILDIGCSTYKIRNDAIGIDIRLHKKPNIVGSVFNIPFPDNYFDSVTMLEVLEHMNKPNQHKALHEIKRVLKPNGLFIMSMPNLSKWFYIPYHMIWAIWEQTVMKEYRHDHIGMFPQSYVESILKYHFQFIKSIRIAWLDRIFIMRK
jgi:SAM-dependent methyltransferase